MSMYWRRILVPPCDRNWNWRSGIGIGIVSSGIEIGIAKSELTPALVWTLLSAVRKGPLKFNHSLTPCIYVGKTSYTYSQYTSICYFLLQTEVKACIGRGNCSVLNNHQQPTVDHLRAAVWKVRLRDVWNWKYTLLLKRIPSTFTEDSIGARCVRNRCRIK